ncbi:MAG: DUF5711 family protein [Oscillospiraceae bacterium]|nr:DUF5711 family protein [Oscillospiraceae bacterium]
MRQLFEFFEGHGFGKFKKIFCNFFLNKKITTAVFCIFVFLIIIFLRGKNSFTKDFILQAQDSFAKFGVGDGFPVKFDGNRVNLENFKSCDNDIFLLSETSFMCFNRFSKKVFSRPHGFSSPVLKVKNKYSLIYNLNESDYKINLRYREVCSQKLLENIISGDISGSGKYVFATNCKEFLSDLTVFDENFEKVFCYHFCDCFINNVAISEDSKTVAASGVLVNNGNFFSVIYVFDLKKEQPKAKFEYEDSLFLEVKFLKNSNVVGISDNMLTVIVPNSNKKTDYFYREKSLSCFDANSKGIAVCLKNDENSDCELILLNIDGLALKNIKVGTNVLRVSYGNNAIAILQEMSMCVYSPNGEKIKSFDVASDIKNISLISCKSIYLLGLHRVSKLDFK